MSERLAKAIAAASCVSRRTAEELIRAGHVSVNGRVISTPAINVDPLADHIQVNGKALVRTPYQYVLLHKPAGVISTAKDPEGRKTVLDFLPTKTLRTLRLYPVGRLDQDTTGLLLLTNDGELALRLTHPRYAVIKKYRVILKGALTEEDRQVLLKGVWLEGKRRVPKRLIVLKKTRGITILDVELGEGKKREIRRLFARLDYQVKKLHRVQVGPLTLGTLKRGAIRQLTNQEVNMLKKAVGLSDV